MKFQSLVISCLISLSTITFANPIQHVAESGIPDSKDLITIQPHTRSAEVNAKHAAVCAERGGVDVTDDSVQQVGHGVTDSVLCKITDKTKYAKYQNIHHPNDPLKQKCIDFGSGYTGCVTANSAHAYGYPYNFSSSYQITTGKGREMPYMVHWICMDEDKEHLSDCGCGNSTHFLVESLQAINYEFITSCDDPLALYHDTDVGWKVNYNLSIIRSTYSPPQIEDINTVKADYPYDQSSNHNYSLTQNLGAPVNNNMCMLQSPDVGNPINVVMSNKFQEEVDFVGKGSYPLEFIRYYNSQDEGGKWRHNYSAHITMTLYDNHNPKISLIHDDGREEIYFESANGELIYKSNSYGILKRTKDGFTYDTPFSEHQEFDRGGFLIKTTKNGLVHNIQHVSKLETVVSDDFGQSMTIMDNGYGNVDYIKTPGGKTYNYKYDGQQRLIEVSKNGKTRKYHYDDIRFPFALTGITDENGSRYVTWTYDNAERAISSEYAGGMNKYTVSRGNYVTVYNPLGGGSRYDYYNLGGMGLVARSYGISDEYNSTGQITKRNDNGVMSTFGYNSAGQETERNVSGVQFGTSWDDKHNKPKTVTYPDKTINYTYDSDGNVTDVVIKANN